VKDLFDTAGIRTTYGSVIFSEHVPEETAAAVKLLEAAGYANVGKTNLHEFAFGTTSQNVHYGVVPNPAAPGRTAGGSSGGSAAALAAGLADAALGTDSGGSVRIPAACCGVTGFKPTFGLVPVDGIFPLAPSFDHAGPMARDVSGCAAMMEVLAPGVSAGEVATGDLRVAYAWFDNTQPLVRARLLEAAAAFPDAAPVDAPLVEGIYPVFNREVAEVHRELYAEHAELYGENLVPKIEYCLATTEAEAAAAAERREAYRARMLELVEPYDLLLTPTLGFVAPDADVDEVAVRPTMVQFTFPFNALGWPVLALPCGAAEDGLPASVQVVGKPGADALVLGAGLALEAALRSVA
jgi:aspartyl-tRNA(Asn)/glutamyl-tRNA(Gln) amidotransferase subunit A